MEGIQSGKDGRSCIGVIMFSFKSWFPYYLFKVILIAQLRVLTDWSYNKIKEGEQR